VFTQPQARCDLGRLAALTGESVHGGTSLHAGRNIVLIIGVAMVAGVLGSLTGFLLFIPAIALFVAAGLPPLARWSAP